MEPLDGRLGLLVHLHGARVQQQVAPQAVALGGFEAPGDAPAVEGALADAQQVRRAAQLVSLSPITQPMIPMSSSTFGSETDSSPVSMP